VIRTGEDCKHKNFQQNTKIHAIHTYKTNKLAGKTQALQWSCSVLHQTCHKGDASPAGWRLTAVCVTLFTNGHEVMNHAEYATMHELAVRTNPTQCTQLRWQYVDMAQHYRREYDSAHGQTHTHNSFSEVYTVSSFYRRTVVCRCCAARVGWRLRVGIR
jgi:hypothetical protein